MKMYIPELGDIIELTKPWKFSLYNESRNKDILKLITDKEVHWDGIRGMKRGIVANHVTFPKGTQLKIDRIYIRKGAEDYSSITFRVSDIPDEGIGKFIGKKKSRFWAKLDDVNTIEYDLVGKKLLK